MSGTTPVATAPVQTTLARLAVGQPVSASHVQAMDDSLSFLAGAVGTQTVVSAFLNPVSTTVASAATSITYQKSPGAKMLLIEFSFYPSASSFGDYGVVTIVLPATATWVNPSATSGTTVTVSGTSLTMTGLRIPTEGTGSFALVRVLADVSALSTATLYDILFTYGNSSLQQGKGLHKIHVREVSLQDTVPTGSEFGVDASWPASNNPLVAGDSAKAYGFARIVGELDNCRSLVRHHWQWAGIDHDTYAWLVNSTSFIDFDYRLPGISVAFSQTWDLRARRLYVAANGSSAGNAVRLRIRYKVTGGATYTFRMIVNGTNHDITGLTGASYGASSTLDFWLPTNTSNQEFSVSFQGNRTAGTGSFYVSNVTLVEIES